jgi:hypothetical protein
MNLVNLEPQQPNNPISVEFNIFKEDLANVLKPNLVLVLVILICIKKTYDAKFDNSPLPRGWHLPDLIIFSGNDERTMWEYISQYTTQLGEGGAYNALKCTCFFIFN